MERIIACFASYGSGGLGQHFAQIIEEARSQDQLLSYYSFGKRADDPACRTINQPLAKSLHYTPVRYFPGWLSYLSCDLFDRAVTERLTQLEAFQGFVGQSLQCFQKLKHWGDSTLYLEAANSHVNNVMRQHQKAIQKFGLEPSWLNEAQRQKTLREYDLADIIYVASEYTRQSFLAEGVSSNKLIRRILTVNPRYHLAKREFTDEIFRIVYCGSLTVMKGIPVLLEAFSKLPGKNVELILVGSWATRGMRHYLQSWLSQDPRIRVVPGDPLPHLEKASVYVHPSYEDGFAYAAMEALACGVPVIVTEDTGMKEYIKEGENGYVIPSGDWESLLERLLDCQFSSITVSSR